MKTDTGVTGGAPQGGGRFFRLPSTKFGRWSFLLAVIFVVLWLINSTVVGGLLVVPDSWNLVVMPIFGILMLLCGLASGILALIAVFRQRERSWLIWLPLLAGALMLFLVLGEFLISH